MRGLEAGPCGQVVRGRRPLVEYFTAKMLQPKSCESRVLFAIITLKRFYTESLLRFTVLHVNSTQPLWKHYLI